MKGADPKRRCLEGRGISLRLGLTDVLQNVDVAIHDGEIVTVVGPNGSGKTTLLRVLLGLVPATEGAVERRPNLHIGYMPQRLAIDPALPMTVSRFLTLGGGRNRDAQRDVLAEVGATRILDSPLGGISGGELQRALLARALLREPNLLVLDEPVQGVDVSGQRDLYRVITRIRDHRGCGVLMVSHDLHLVMASTDRVLCLNRHVCCSGRPEAVSRDPAFLALFGPDTADGLAIYTHHHDHAHDVAGAVVPMDGQNGQSDDG